MNKLLLLCFLVVLLLNSCAKSVNSEVEIYSNDFENGVLTGINNAVITSFAGTKVLGTYNNGGFDLMLNELPTHDLVDISFDLYIHDNWVGNQRSNDNEVVPDIWQFKVDNKTFISTTFSNQDCIPGNICPPQSYPADYPNNNHNPRFGAASVNLPGVCSQLNSPNGSTLYKISKSISHTNKTLLIQCVDKLIQKSVVDMKCNSSWSIDNISIKVINLR